MNLTSFVKRFLKKSVNVIMNLTFITDVEVVAIKNGESEIRILKGEKPYKVSNTRFNSNSVDFTLHDKARIIKFPTKYLLG